MKKLPNSTCFAIKDYGCIFQADTGTNYDTIPESSESFYNLISAFPISIQPDIGS